jgi:hypothetical protein
MKKPRHTIMMHWCDAVEGWWWELERGEVNTWSFIQWCKENGVEYVYADRGESLGDRDSLLYAVFFNEIDATLCYLRFR